MLYINRASPYRIVNVEGDYQMVAAQVYISTGRRITFGSMYISPGADFVEDRVKDMLEKLPRPVIVMGELNAYHEDWGNRVTDRRGRLATNIINTLGWTIINNGQSTHLSGTAVDLTIVSPELVPDLD